MNYHPSDMSQPMSMAPSGAYAPSAMPPTLHGYQPAPPQQHHHHHQPQAPRHHQAPPHQQQQHHPHQHPHPHSHQHPHSGSHPHPIAAHQHPHPHPPAPLPDQHHHHIHHQPPPTAQSTRSDDVAPPLSAEEQSRTGEVLASVSKVDESTGRQYSLDVVQQPRRARMCGFGDKDRRPITPPPCVRLVVRDIATGKEVDCNEIDHSMFVLNVDLWSEDGKREVNLVRSSSGNPAISSTTPFSYTTLNGAEVTPVSYSQQVVSSGREPAYNVPHAVGYPPEYQVQSGYAQVTPAYSQNGSFGPAQQYYPQHQSYRPDQGVSPLASQANMAQYGRNGAPPAFGGDQTTLARMAMVGGQPSGMFTRNLIGSLAASAFRLTDTSDRIGVWFVLQDLSVRTEGPFRLRFSFVNVGSRHGGRDQESPKVIHGRAPILASCFSEPFMVYSAKKFPGVCESTPLSKSFAAQGIKIPIRKDANGKGGDDDDYGDM